MKISRILLLLVTTAALAVPIGATATSSATAATGPEAPAATADSADPTLLTWRGHESKARLPVAPDVLPGAPKSFRTYARAQLRDTWTDLLDHRPACKRAPLMDVRQLRTDGFAYGYVSTSPQPGCQTGGGYVAFWAIRKGEWKQVIGTQDVARCSRLEKLDFPSSVADVQCSEGTDVIDYSHP